MNIPNENKINMASREEWCADKLSKLLKEELRISTLNEIKDHLESLPTNEVKPTVNLLELPLVFDCLNNTNTEQIDLACNILSFCLDNLSIEECSTKYGTPLERALSHPYPAVKLMVLKELERDIKNEDILIDLCKRFSLLESLVRCLGCEVLEVASRSSKILKLIGCSDIGIKKLTSSDLINVFHEVISMNDIVRLRVFEVFVEIAKESKTNFQCLNSSGLISCFLNDLDSNDILLRMNVIEILSQLGKTEYGFEYLESHDVISKLGSILKSDDSIDLQLCQPGILKFFGNIGNCQPNRIIEQYSYVLKKMFENINSSDFSLVGVSLDTIGYIGSTTNGKCALDSMGIVENGMSLISSKLGTFPTEITVRALKCIENLLSTDENNLRVQFISQKWFSALGPNAMTNIILKYAKNPFFELRIAGLSVINSISNQIWGQEVIQDTPGLIEFLLDRNVETHKESKDLKYEIVKVLSESSVLDSSTVKRLKNYVKEGAFYVQGVMEVAFEENN
ncbi:26S proteasome non-ATPase regulatory subunit 5 [Coccinella septempunctata]|uniref:26S proteasome non-ATPase regulatory subunit 5 n=1 Tax=Coccinella septempunctata TaxID=41139 RepID=UPI001D08DDBD|nr:26S proteasome non-ATPase regulatory subunit 5 [Coccinella septempunctata]